MASTIDSLREHATGTDGGTCERYVRGKGTDSGKRGTWERNIRRNKRRELRSRLREQSTESSGGTWARRNGTYAGNIRDATINWAIQDCHERLGDPA
jgi:hypothetical protein